MKLSLIGVVFASAIIFFSSPVHAMSDQNRACLEAQKILVKLYPEHRGKGKQIRGCNVNVFAFTLAVIEVGRASGGVFRKMPSTVGISKALRQGQIGDSIKYFLADHTRRLNKRLPSLAAKDLKFIAEQLRTASGNNCYESVRQHVRQGETTIDDCTTEMLEHAAMLASYTNCFRALTFCARKAPKIARDLAGAAGTMATELKGFQQRMSKRKSELRSSKGACRSYRMAKRACKDTSNRCKLKCGNKSRRRDRRQCRKQCRRDKRACKGDLREQKTACKTRRRTVGKASIGTVVDTIGLVQDARAGMKTAKQAYDLLSECKKKVAVCSAL